MTNKKKSVTDIEDLILGIIKDNYSNPDFSVLSLSDKLRLCVCYLREIVFDKFGIYPQKLIEEYRLNMALKLILTDEDLQNIYRQAGLIMWINYYSLRRRHISYIFIILIQ